jgi:C4-dicarboxylate-specific signal transduction histidine kinase
VRVLAERGARALAISVVDEGDTRDVSLDDLTAAFRKGASSTGLGLGLSMVAQIARALGGGLEHEGSPTTFRLVVTDLRRAARARQLAGAS